LKGAPPTDPWFRNQIANGRAIRAARNQESLIGRLGNDSCSRERQLGRT
jgi:hypothetical protein